MQNLKLPVTSRYQSLKTVYWRTCLSILINIRNIQSLRKLNWLILKYCLITYFHQNTRFREVTLILKITAAHKSMNTRIFKLYTKYQFSSPRHVINTYSWLFLREQASTFPLSQLNQSYQLSNRPQPLTTYAVLFRTLPSTSSWPSARPLSWPTKWHCENKWRARPKEVGRPQHLTYTNRRWAPLRRLRRAVISRIPRPLASGIATWRWTGILWGWNRSLCP